MRWIKSHGVGYVRSNLQVEIEKLDRRGARGAKIDPAHLGAALKHNRAKEHNEVAQYLESKKDQVQQFVQDRRQAFGASKVAERRERREAAAVDRDLMAEKRAAQETLQREAAARAVENEFVMSFDAERLAPIVREAINTIESADTRRSVELVLSKNPRNAAVMSAVRSYVVQSLRGRVGVFSH